MTENTTASGAADLLRELLQLVEAQREYIHAIPDSAFATFPAMPGFDRDWADDLVMRAKALAAFAPVAPTQPASKRLIGWRTPDYLEETADAAIAKNWSVHHDLLPIFEGDAHTKLATPEAAPVAPAPPPAPVRPSMREELQKQCSDWKTYWRASDSHGVVLTCAQAVELLERALGVEVEVKATICETCDDNGMIGNPVEGGVPCPDCTPKAAPAINKVSDIIDAYGMTPGQPERVADIPGLAEALEAAFADGSAQITGALQQGEYPETLYEGGRESVDDALAVVESFGPGVQGLNDTFARQVLLGQEVRRLRAAYEHACQGRSDFRNLYRAARGAAQAAPAEDDKWRSLALQFDGHRMQALWHLKLLLECGEDHAEAVRTFLAGPPLHGEIVLAQRIAAYAQQPAPVAEGFDEWLEKQFEFRNYYYNPRGPGLMAVPFARRAYEAARAQAAQPEGGAK